MDDNLYSKVKKLLAFGEGKVANEAEMNNALGLAMRLLAKQNMTLDDFKKVQNEQDDLGVQEYAGGNEKRLANWKGKLAVAVCKANFCFCYRQQQNLYIAGKPDNRNAAIVMLDYLFFIIDATTVNAFERYHGSEHGKTFCNNFRQGMVAVLIQRIHDEMENIVNEFDSTALVKIDVYDDNQNKIVEWLSSGNVNLTKAIKYNTKRSSEAMALGMDAGTKVSLRPTKALAGVGG